MKYYLCIVGNFDGAKLICDECLERGIYQYYRTIRQIGPASAIEGGDILFLVFEKQIKGYGLALKVDDAKKIGHDESWRAIRVQDGWRKLSAPIPLPYGVFQHTIRGTKQSIVKEIMPNWAIEILLQLKRARKENFSERVATFRLPELAIGLKTDFFAIPELQRGLVWNSTRCEVLWDSILRGLPIGAISIRPTDDGRYELFDGQQRANAIALGYADWPTNDSMASILWIDLAPEKPCERKFVFMMTTPAHPWGYEVSSDEKSDNRLKAQEQKIALESLERIGGGWERHSKKGARPYARELWPIKARLPVPFTLLRQYVELRPNHSPIDFSGFRRYCEEKCASHNWWLWQKSCDIIVDVEMWTKIVDAIRELPNYALVALNGHVKTEDLGLYFKRMNKQGVVPDDEEIRYSLLKSKLPCLKSLDELAAQYTKTRPSWLADIAVRFWLSRRDGWKWTPSAAIDKIEVEDPEFPKFIKEKDGFPGLLENLYRLLTESDGLLPWHFRELYRHGQGSHIALFLLREIAERRPTDYFKALTTCVLWFSYDIGKCAKILWEKVPNASVQSALFDAIRQNVMARVFTKDEVNVWAKKVKEAIGKQKWEDAASLVNDPYIGQALARIWWGFNGGNGCSLLLFACRKFVNEYFDEYDPCAPEWREQNRPWDYDHILPRAWLGEKRINERTDIVRKFLWSIGNSAPLPFTLNRGKNDQAPDNYPNPEPASAAEKLHVDREQTNRFGVDKAECNDRLDKCDEASKNFIATTVDRIVRMIADWYCTCKVGQLMRFDDCRDKRREFFEALMPELNKHFGKSSVWFVNGARQYPVRISADWARPWLSCGVCGRIAEGGVRCLLGVASEGTILEIGIRRHPEENGISVGGWWYDGAYKRVNMQDVTRENVVEMLKNWREEFGWQSDDKTFR